LYNSVPYDSVELESIVCEAEDQIRVNIAAAAGHLVCSEDVKDAIDKLKPYKSDGYSACSSDHFIHAGSNLCIYLALLVSSMIVHGSVPDDFSRSTIIPIKNKHLNISDSSNYHGIALCSIRGKLFDNMVLNKHCENLCTSDLQFGFKKNSSTHVYNDFKRDAIILC
jgi:hypothetical protein